MTHTVYNLNGDVVSERPAAVTAPTDADLRAAYLASLDAYLDTVAQSLGFDNRVTAALRAGYPGPFRQVGSAFAGWMDECYVAAEQLAGNIAAGRASVPASVDEFIGRLPPAPFQP